MVLTRLRAVLRNVRSSVLLTYLKLLRKVLGISAITRVLHRCGNPDITRKILETFGATIGSRNVRIGPYILIHNAERDFANLYIGEDVYIGPEVMLDLASEVIFRNHTAVGLRAQVFTHSNFVGTYGVLFPWESGPVVFEEYAGCNPGSIIIGPAVIGRNSYISPGSVVLGDVPSYVIVRGNPASICARLPERLMRSYEDTCRRQLGWQ